LHETKVSSSIVKVDNLSYLQRDFDDWLLLLGLILVVAFDNCDEKLFTLCVLKDHLLKVAIHEVVLVTDVQFHVEHLVFGMGSAMLFFDYVLDLTQLGLFGYPDLDNRLGAQLISDDVKF
jgi:hypothetical protein